MRIVLIFCELRRTSVIFWDNLNENHSQYTLINVSNSLINPLHYIYTVPHTVYLYRTINLLSSIEIFNWLPVLCEFIMQLQFSTEINMLTKTFNVVLVATNLDIPESTPISESHWLLTAEEVQAVSASFIAAVYSQWSGNIMLNIRSDITE